MAYLFTVAKAKITWTEIDAHAYTGESASEEFKPPRVRYKATFRARSVTELDWNYVEQTADGPTWDILVREVLGTDEVSRSVQIVFQFRSWRAPHHLLQKGLRFELIEAVEPKWTGVIEDVWKAPAIRATES